MAPVHELQQFTDSVSGFKPSHFFLWLILKSILCYTFKSSLHIKSLLSRGLKVGNTLWCTPCFRLLLWYLTSRERKTHINWKTMLPKKLKSKQHEQVGRPSYHTAIATVHINLVTQHYKREVLRVGWASLKR